MQGDELQRIIKKMFQRKRELFAMTNKALTDCDVKAGQILQREYDQRCEEIEYCMRIVVDDVDKPTTQFKGGTTTSQMLSLDGGTHGSIIPRAED